MADNVYKRVAKAMETVSYVQKEKKSGMNYSIVSHDAVTAKVRPALLEAGVVYHPVALEHWQNGNRTECRMVTRFVNIDDREDYFDVPSLGYGIDNQDKGPGKAISYATKYALLKALGLETGDDPDYEQIEHKPEPKAKPKPALADTEWPVGETWIVPKSEQIGPKRAEGLHGLLHKKGLDWSVVQAEWAADHTKLLPDNLEEVPIAATKALSDLIGQYDDAKDVSLEDMTPEERAKAEELVGAMKGGANKITGRRPSKGGAE